MSKTITIPSDRGSRVYVTINGKDYVYTAGATETVPDEVAALFESNSYQEVQHGRHAAAPLDAKRKGDKEAVPVLVDDQGRLHVPTAAALSGIHVEGHKLIIPDDGE